jgi:site-specific recombinase XerD
MSALPKWAQAPSPWPSMIEFPWADTACRAPLMVATMASYLDQLAVSARPTTVGATELGLRHFAGQVTEADPTCTSMAAVERRHVEAHKLWLAARPGRGDKPVAPVTIRHRLGLLRTFFERLRDWDYEDAPKRTLIFPGDLPQPDEPLPKFLDDPTMEKFTAALASDPDPRRRLMVEILAQTGIRVGELSGLDDKAVTQLGDTMTLRIPVGKLHNDRYVPIGAELAQLIADYQRFRGPSLSGRLVERDDGNPFDRRTIHRYVDRVAKRAGVGHVHPHQLRHTLATRMINRGMSLEAIAALLGHRSMRMTLTYARISNRTVAEEYFRVTQAVEASYESGEPLPASVEGANMRRIAAEQPSPLGQWSLHPAGRARLHLRVSLRALWLLRDRTSVPHHPETPAN